MEGPRGGVEHHVGLGGLQPVGGLDAASSTRCRAAVRTAEPASWAEREAAVSPLVAISAVSPDTTLMRSSGIPVTSAAIMAQQVAWPCPNAVAPLRTTSDPSAASSISPSSLGPIDVLSTNEAMPMPSSIGSLPARRDACSARSSSYRAAASARSRASPKSPVS